MALPVKNKRYDPIEYECYGILWNFQSSIDRLFNSNK